MFNIFVETYDCVDSDVSFGVDIYDVELGMVMIGEGYYHVPFSSLVFKDLSNGKFVNFVCLECEILSVVSDYYGHIFVGGDE